MMHGRVPLLWDEFNLLKRLKNNWVQPSAADRDESNVELFYRFPLFPHVDTTLSYQMIFNPALDPSNDFGSAFSFRFRSLW